MEAFKKMRKGGGKIEEEQENGRKMNKSDGDRGTKERGMGKWEQKREIGKVDEWDRNL